MDVICDAASSMAALSGAACVADPAPVKPDQEQMVDALKRAIIEYDTRVQQAEAKAATISQELQMEKREHERTTSKLTTLLRKRSASSEGCTDGRPEIEHL